MTTIIQTTRNGDKWVASTPHAPELKAEHESESEAVNQLIALIRAHTGPWSASATATKGDDVITRDISGVWPTALETDSTETQTEPVRQPRRRTTEPKTPPAPEPEVKE